MQMDKNGVISPARYIASPYCDLRSNVKDIRLLVIHNISLPPGEFSGEAVIALFTGKLDANTHPYFAQIHQLQVSAHFFIRRDGELIQFVPCSKRAWHCGVSNWQGWERCNDFSIGIELEGDDHSPFTDAQYRQLDQLTRTLQIAYPHITITGHSDIAPGRKTDPGPCFDWLRYRGLIGAPS